MMKVEIVSKETIVPSSPTPNHHKIYRVSILDQVIPSFYISLVLIYRNAYHRYDQVSQTLKNSLSDTLTLFYPLAGKIKDNVSVDCNDAGVPCYETRVHSSLDQMLLAYQDCEYLKRLVVVGDDVNTDTGAQLLVQINLFNCGTIALGLSFSHKLCDVATIATFLKSWSAYATNSGRPIVPDLTISTIFPPRGDVSIVRPVIAPPASDDTTTARLVFDGPKLDALKALSASQSTPQPTRVEAVTALIVKCAVTASNRTQEENRLMPYIVSHPVNIRKKLAPALPENMFGNVVGPYILYSQQRDANLDTLVDGLRKSRTEYCLSVAMNKEKAINDLVYLVENSPTTSQNDSIQIFPFSSWCRFGLYETDFGIGKPIFVGAPSFMHKNQTVLLDTKDGNGIEAYVSLGKQEMSLFRDDLLLLGYASINPAA